MADVGDLFDNEVEDDVGEGDAEEAHADSGSEQEGLEDSSEEDDGDNNEYDFTDKVPVSLGRRCRPRRALGAGFVRRRCELCVVVGGCLLARSTGKRTPGPLGSQTLYAAVAQFIVGEDEAVAEENDEGSSDEQLKVKKKRKRHFALEDDDYELLEENHVTVGVSAAVAPAHEGCLPSAKGSAKDDFISSGHPEAKGGEEADTQKER